MRTILSLTLSLLFISSVFTNELITSINRNKYEVTRYQDHITISSTFDADGDESKIEKRVDNVDVDFIVAIKKKKAALLGSKNYSYEAYLLILKMTHIVDGESTFIGGYDIYNEAKPEGEIPLCKYSFDDNGKMVDIQMPEGISSLTYTLLKDLVEKMTPTLRKSVYSSFKPNSNLRYMFGVRNDGELDLFETQTPTPYRDDINQIYIDGTSVQKSTIRTVNKGNLQQIRSSDVFRMTNLPSNDGEQYDANIGMNFMEYDIQSEVTFITTTINPFVVDFLGMLEQDITFMDYKDFKLDNGTYDEDDKEEEEEQPASNLRNLAGNFKSSTTQYINIFNVKVCNIPIKLDEKINVDASGKKVTNKWVVESNKGSKNFGTATMSYLLTGKSEKTLFDGKAKIDLLEYRLTVG